MNKILKLKYLTDLSYDDIAKLCSMGYRLAIDQYEENIGIDEQEMIKILEYIQPEGIRKLAGTCPVNIIQGTTHNITVTGSGGVKPYTFKVFRDLEPIPLYTYVGSLTDTSHTFIHIFNESIATHTFRGETVDSCGVSQTASETCNFNIVVGCVDMVVNPISMDGSPGCLPTIVQGTTHTINGFIASGGKSPYYYRFLVDGIQKVPWTAIIGTTPPISFSFSYIFSEAISATPHTYRLEIEDSCPAGSGGPIIKFSSCPVTITCNPFTAKITIV